MDTPTSTVFVLEKERAYNEKYSNFLLQLCRDAAGHDLSPTATLQVNARFVGGANNVLRFQQPCPICPSPTYHEVTWSRTAPLVDDNGVLVHPQGPAHAAVFTLPGHSFRECWHKLYASFLFQKKTGAKLLRRKSQSAIAVFADRMAFMQSQVLLLAQYRAFQVRVPPSHDQTTSAAATVQLDDVAMQCCE